MADRTPDEVKQNRIYGLVQRIFEVGINTATLDSLTVDGTAEADSVNTVEATINGRPAATKLTQSQIGQLTEHAGDLVTVDFNETQVVYDLTEAQTLVYGYIAGGHPKDVIVTFSDGTSESLVSASGRGQFPQQFTFPTIPDVKRVEFVSGSSTDYGWCIYTE